MSMYLRAIYWLLLQTNPSLDPILSEPVETGPMRAQFCSSWSFDKDEMKITMKTSSFMNSRIIGHKLGFCEHDLWENTTKFFFSHKIRKEMPSLYYGLDVFCQFEARVWDFDVVYTSTAVQVFQGERQSVKFWLSEFWYSKPNCCSQTRWSSAVEPVDEWRHPHVERWRQPTLLQGWVPRPRRSSLLDGVQPGGGRLCQLCLWHREKN